MVWEALVKSGHTSSVWWNYSQTEYLVSAPQHFWISFQGEPEPARSLGGLGSLCHCQKVQANPSSGCPSLPDSTWGCCSGQELQQEADQREHTGDEWGSGPRASMEYPSWGSFFVCLSRLSLSQDALPVLPYAWMPSVYSWWFSFPAVAAGEVASLKRVQFCSIKSPSHVWPFMAYGFQHARLPCPLPYPGACWNSCQLSRWCHPTISSFVILLSSAFHLSFWWL